MIEYLQKHEKGNEPGMKKQYTLKQHTSDYRRKLLLSIFRIAAPVIALICGVSILLLSNSSRQTALKSQAAVTEKMSSDLSHVITNTETLSQDMIFNNEIQQLLATSTAGEQFPQNADAAYHINGFIANRDYINCVVLTGNTQTLYSTEKAFTNITDFHTIQSSAWFAQLQDSTTPYLWFTDPDFSPATTTADTEPSSGTSTDTSALHTSDHPDADTETSQSASGSGTSDRSTTTGSDTAVSDPQSSRDIPHFMMARPVYSMEDYTTKIGYLMLYLDNDFLSNTTLSSFRFGQTTNAILTDKSGMLLLRNPSEEDYSFILKDIRPEEGGQIILSHGRQFAVNVKPVFGQDCYVYIITPLQEINSNMTIFLAQSILLALATVAFLFFLAFRTASTLSSPIIRLAEVMDSYRNKNAEAILPPKDDYQNQPEEIARIYQSYTQMVTRMDTLIRDNFIKNLEKKDAELALLQSQINPHFLYNTLDSINWMAIANDEDEISEMVTALSDMFRLSLTKSHSSYIALGTEMEYVQSYLTLQQFRYQDCLNASVSIKPEQEILLVPRFTLQPLVENAIKHGMISPDDPFSIDISVRAEQDTLLIIIGNDGHNIQLEQMQKLLDFNIEKQEILDFDQNSYGVQNIHRRICILCGPGYGLSYEVRDGRTYCTVRLPKKTSEAPEM